jgi:hypothetical protein
MNDLKLFVIRLDFITRDMINVAIRRMSNDWWNFDY